MSERKPLAPAAADHGVSAALIAHLMLFEVMSRHSGRTDTMLRAARPGDCLITITQTEARRLIQRLREMGKEGVEVAALDPTRNPMEQRGAQPRGAVIFDHNWIQAFWTYRIERALGDFRTFQREMSKADLPELETSIRDRSLNELIRRL